MIDSDKLYIEQMITGSFVKYSRLSELISTTYAGSNCTEINLFIDLNSILKRLYSIDAWSYRYKNIYEMAACIINMCGHYRSFFRHLGVYTNIYLIYGLNCPTMNDTLVKGYNNKFIQSYIKKADVTKLIDSNMKLLDLLCQYLPRIYFFNIGTCEVSSMIDHLINKNPRPQDGVENIVISKDILMLPLIASYNVRILRPNKTKDGDLSYIVDRSNLITSFCTLYRKCKVPTEIVSINYIQNILAMTRVQERDMYSVLSIPKVFHILNIGITMRFLDPNQFYNQASINTILEAMDISVNKDELDARFKAINPHYQAAFILLMEKPVYKNIRLVDLEDIKSVKEIVNTYFADIPINLDNL